MTDDEIWSLAKRCGMKEESFMTNPPQFAGLWTEREALFTFARAISEQVSPCPRCGSTNTERHYARQDGGTRSHPTPWSIDGADCVNDANGRFVAHIRDFPDAYLHLSIAAINAYEVTWPGCLDCEYCCPIEEWPK